MDNFTLGIFVGIGFVFATIIGMYVYVVVNLIRGKWR